MIRLFWPLLVMMIVITPGTLAQSEAESSGACAQALEPGETEQTLQVDDLERRYLRYIPSGYDGETPLPVVLNLHGFAGSPSQQREASGFNELAEDENFIVVYPRGTGFPLRWANGTNEFTQDDSLIDVNFLRALVNHLADTTCIDPARVYISGFSAGGGMANRAACQLSDLFAAFGTVAGAYSNIPGGCEPERPIPMITLHGTGDGIVPYEGRGVTLPFIPDWVEGWAERNACDLTPDPLDVPGEVEAVAYTGCDDAAQVTFYTVIDGGHIWYGGTPPPLFGEEDTSGINASAILWDFFQQFQLP